MADGTRTLSALHVASDRRRWRLLKHAVENGPFLATRAASIAKLSRKSGNARTTHAEGLRKVGLLQRERGRPVRYRATASGIHLYHELKRILAGTQPNQPDEAGLGVGDHVDIRVSGESSPKREVVVRITRKT